MTNAALIERANAALQAMGLAVHVTRPPRGAAGVRADAWLRVGTGGRHADYVVEAKRAVTPATLGAAAAQLREQAERAGRPALLVADYLTPQVAQQLRAQGVQFADAAGNAYLEAPGMLVYVQGCKPAARPATRRADALGTAGIKVLFALLCEPPLANAPQRAIAAAAGVALGAVPGVVADLQRTGHLLVAKRTRRLNPTKRLLDTWAHDYAGRLRAKTLIQAYTAPAIGTWRDWKIDPRQVRWGGEPAGALLVGHLRPGILTLYADKLPARLIVEQRMTAAVGRPTEIGVEQRKPFWGATLLAAQPLQATVPVPLVYADLLATGDARCLETAQMIYDAYLARLFPAT